MKTTQRGFVTPLLIVTIAVFVVGGVYMIFTKWQSSHKPMLYNDNGLFDISITSLRTRTTDPGRETEVVISGVGLPDGSTAEYLKDGEHIESFCAYREHEGSRELVHGWSEPEGGWQYYSGINQVRIINNDCRNSRPVSEYPVSAVFPIRIVNNLPIPR